tara:strand:+ start:323 stop:556 length:234 start_codon:yes stop_codon:yes gene_type:complete
MENYTLKVEQLNNKVLAFDDWVDANLNILNEIIYCIIHQIDNDSSYYKFTIDENKLYNELLHYIYETSTSRYKKSLY